MAHPELNRPFRDWLADRLTDFSEAIRRGEDPEVTFSVQPKGLPKILCQIRLIDLPGEYTREDYPVEIVQEHRS